VLLRVSSLLRYRPFFFFTDTSTAVIYTLSLHDALPIYVKVAGKWHYICVFIDLFNREIVGYSAGSRKNAALVSSAISTIKHDLRDVQMFHTDRRKEFDNQLIDEVLDGFDIERSLSMKGCPYDNAVAETTFKAMKTEFINQYTFISLKQLNIELFDYVNWYNN